MTKKLNQARARIAKALQLARDAEASNSDPELSFIDDDALRSIARELSQAAAALDALTIPPLATAPVKRKKRIRQVAGLLPTDRIVVTGIEGDSLKDIKAAPGDSAVLKLNFTKKDLTPGRLIVAHIHGCGRLVKRYHRDSNGQIRLESLNKARWSDLYLDDEQMTVEALVMRIDRVVWEHGKSARKGSAAQQQEPSIDELRARLNSIEHLPENEAVRFQLETQIHRLEQEQEEWPEVIGGEVEL